MWEKATGMKARQTLSETWWAELTWKGTATAPSKQSVKPFRAETARWHYGGPQGYQKRCGSKSRNSKVTLWWATRLSEKVSVQEQKQQGDVMVGHKAIRKGLGPRAETARWRYGGPQGYQKRCGSKSKRASFFLRLPLDKSMALDAFWPEPETITLKMLWVLKGCEIKIKTETKKLPLAWYWEKETVNLDLRIDCNLLDNRL